MSVRWELHPISALLEIAPTWDAINAFAGKLPFLESGFLLPLVTHFAKGDERVAIAYRHKKPIAAAILQRQGLGRWASFQPSQLPLGPWITVQGENTAKLAEQLLANLPGMALGIGITQLDPYIAARPENDKRVQTLDYIQTGWVNVDRSFDMYWETRGKNLRTNMRKQRSKLETEGVVISCDSITDPALVAGALSEYSRLETSGWKSGRGTAVRTNDAQGRFYREMMECFCERGRGRIWQLKFNDKIVAMDLCIESSETLVVLKTAFDSDYRSFSPAFLMRQDAFRQIFDEARIKRIEFYGRLMEWHTRWTEQSRVLYHSNVYRWAFISALRDLLRRRPHGTANVAMTNIATEDA